ncbi:DMT family transporter [uncultured Friedmanniella sp.]|uniref:DMT family transporter n=1 Tax=uncultured Friedmanniella sp. TaxID=335381 RepID=UPI0035C9E872
MTSRRGLAQISLAGVLWGTGGLAVQLIRERTPMSVLTISAWRMLLAAVVLLVMLLALRRLPELRRLLRQRPWTAVTVGLCTGAYQALYFGAVVAVGVTVSTVVALGLAPVLLTLAESVTTGRRPDRTQLLILVAALGGLVLVSAAAGLSVTGPRPLLGVGLAVASGATYALATALGRPLAGTTSPLALTAVTSSAGALGLLPLGLLAGAPYVSSDPVVVGLLGYLGVMTLAVAYGLLYAGLRTVAGSAAVVATLLEPVTAAVLAAIVLGERPGVLGVIGAALILLAVAGSATAPPEAPVS